MRFNTWGPLLILTLLLGFVAHLYFAAPPERYLVPGQQWLGEPVRDLSPATIDPTPMDVRKGCFWGQPGSHPFTGNHYSAMRAMGATPEEALEGAQQVKHPERYAKRIYRSNAGMWTSDNKMIFLPTSVQSFGKNIVCLGTTANFRSDDAIEVGDLYHFGDVWYVVWHACNNGDRVFPVPDAVITVAPLYGAPRFGPVYPGPAGLPGAGRRDQRVNALLYPPIYLRPPLRGAPIPHKPVPDTDTPVAPVVNTVPEPATWALVIVGLLAMRKKRHGDV